MLVSVAAAQRRRCATLKGLGVMRAVCGAEARRYSWRPALLSRWGVGAASAAWRHAFAYPGCRCPHGGSRSSRLPSLLSITRYYHGIPLPR